MFRTPKSSNSPVKFNNPQKRPNESQSKGSANKAMKTNYNQQSYDQQFQQYQQQQLMLQQQQQYQYDQQQYQYDHHQIQYAQQQQQLPYDQQQLQYDQHQVQYNQQPGHSRNEDGEPRFTFDEVKEMLERLLSKQTRASAAVSAGLKKVNFDEIAVEGHSVQQCKDLIEQLVQNTRRVRTLQEVLVDIKENLKKRAYTEIIHRATLKGELPKKPPSAYLLYHQDRYNELRNENSLAVEVSKIVAEEWKTISDKKRREYHRRHEELVKKYEKDMQRLGLVDDAAPKRPKSAKSLFIDDALAGINTTNWSKERMAQKRDELGQVFENLHPDNKARWIMLHKENQDRYQREKEEYIAAHPHLNHSGPEKKPRVSEKIKPPAGPKSALKFFLQKKLPEGLEGQELEEARKRLKDKFAHLQTKKSLKYIKKAIQDKERYDREVEEFKKQHPGREIAKTKPNVSKDQWKLYAKVVENRPHLPAPTAYLHYCGRMLTDMNDNDDAQVPTKRMQTASVAWKISSLREKKLAEREHMADIERYINEMDSWLFSQTEERKRQVLSEEPKANPDFWRKKLNRMRKAEKKCTK